MNPPSLYGIWNNIFDLTAYFTLANGLFPFWATRFVARKMKGTVKTGLLANLVVALVATAIYIPIVFPATQAFHSQAYLAVYIVAALQIVNTYLIVMLEGCLRSLKPQAIGYGLLIEEIVKVSLALPLILGLHQLFMGAMVSMMTAASVQALYYIRLLSKYLNEPIQWNYLKEWLKGSIVNIYSAVGVQLNGIVFILLYITPVVGPIARADYAAAAVFANVIGYASFISFALYPKLLAKACAENEVAQSFKTTLMLAIPFIVVAIAMPTSLLTILNVAYSGGSTILILLTLDAVVLLVGNFYNLCVFGVEHLDEEGKISLKQLVRSKIFQVFTVPYIQAALVLPIVYFFVTRATLTSPVQAASFVIIINMSIRIATVAGLYAAMRKSIRIIIDWKSRRKVHIRRNNSSLNPSSPSKHNDPASYLTQGRHGSRHHTRACC